LTKRIVATGTQQPPEGSWKPGPTDLFLSDGAVHVWRAELASTEPGLNELLSRDERRRAERMASPQRRQLWVSSRAVLRALLGRYLGHDPGELRFVAGEHGKPALPGGEVCFNLSHSAGLALYAFSSSGAVGVDVELHRRSIDAIGLASRMFGSEVASELERLEAPAREREFLRLWTRREATIKLYGGELDAGAAGEPWITELNVGAGAAGAVATAKPTRKLSCWRY
jgi:4'-phosphopantetheinyl transferase